MQATRLPQDLSNQLTETSRRMALLCAFGIPWANGFFNWGFYLMMICFLLGIGSQTRWREVLTSPVVIIALLMFGWILLRTLTAPLGWDLARPDLLNYRKLLAIPVLVTLFPTTEHKRQLVIAYCLGVAVLMLPTLLDGVGLGHLIEHMTFFKRNAAYSLTDRGAPNLVYWRNQIAHGFHVSTLLAACLVSAVTCKRYRPHLIAVAALCAADLLFFIYGRMALLSLFVSLVVIGTLMLPSKKHVALMLGGIAILATTAFITIPTVQVRLSSIKTETASFIATKDITTAAGQRLHYWGVSWDMFRESPLFGAGSGAFKARLRATKDPLLPAGHGHTHDEYLTQLSLYGLVGLAFYLALLGITFRNARRLGDPWLAGFTTSAVLLFALNAVTDSSLHNDWEGWTFVLLAAIACGRIGDTRAKGSE